ncbi:MAG: DoxX family protein [Gammaproteobacteria bacterium]|uniref:DoxX family protein n=1 Tax=Hydrogenophaga sp. TaxID=1904254 RepID=UPI0025C3E339|nr:DoxX family protein [Hydrogenophaga sp.]MBU4180769.1 DoxX family protein [Gammaproteobacteria bacterium]MBU4281516.1 DoxX family protein [Gammaproteobacteria bacterium]MBU4323147.1 DoxX family protein [Gammaproteobacteria bacterium]MBU4505975.1 DoxX family protein [Gammaproteobacteria bacterium]MCG2655670.1 DoxX family protein [Hydrogenophaga sp.]
MHTLQNPLALLSRLLLAALFLPAGIGKITGFAGTAGYIASVGLPMPTVAAAVAIAVEVLGGLALIVGFGTRWAALALALFTLGASFFFHNYWAMLAEQQMMQHLMFMKNIGVTGGLLALAAFGAGAFSLDARRSA